MLGPVPVPPTWAWTCPPPERTQSRQWGEGAGARVSCLQGWVPVLLPVTQAPGDITHPRLRCQPSGEVLQRVLPSTRGPPVAVSAALSPFPPAEGPAFDQRPGFPWAGSGPRLRTDLSGSARAGETPCSFFLDACECDAGSWGFPGGLQGSPIKPVVRTVPYGNIGNGVSGTQVMDTVLPNEKVSAQQTADSPRPKPPLPLMHLRAREARGAVSPVPPRPPPGQLQL